MGVAQEVSDKQLRLWLLSTGVDTIHSDSAIVATEQIGRAIAFSIKWRVHGYSPASHANVYADSKIVRANGQIPIFEGGASWARPP